MIFAQETMTEEIIVDNFAGGVCAGARKPSGVVRKENCYDGRTVGGISGMKSPCVKDCPDRLPCGACRKSCEAFREYEAQRLENVRSLSVGSLTAGKKSMCRADWRSTQRGKNHRR